MSRMIWQEKDGAVGWDCYHGCECGTPRATCLASKSYDIELSARLDKQGWRDRSESGGSSSGFMLRRWARRKTGSFDEQGHSLESSVYMLCSWKKASPWPVHQIRMVHYRLSRRKCSVLEEGKAEEGAAQAGTARRKS